MKATADMMPGHDWVVLEDGDWKPTAKKGGFLKIAPGGKIAYVLRDIKGKRFNDLTHKDIVHAGEGYKYWHWRR